MTHNTINYTGRASAAFDAIEDIKEFLGQERWDKLSPDMAKIVDPDVFSFVASFAGVQGFPVRCWYELYHGQGSWAIACDASDIAKAHIQMEDVA